MDSHETLVALKTKMNDFREYKEPCSCCDHESLYEAIDAGNRTNELFEMIKLLVLLYEKGN